MQKETGVTFNISERMVRQWAQDTSSGSGEWIITKNGPETLIQSILSLMGNGGDYPVSHEGLNTSVERLIAENKKNYSFRSHGLSGIKSGTWDLFLPHDPERLEDILSDFLLGEKGSFRMNG